MATTILNPDGTQANGNGGPWWAKSIWTVGPLTIIALGLVYLLAFEVRGDAKAAAITAASMKSELAAHHSHTEKLHGNIEDYMRVQLLLMRQMCSSAARTTDERDRCFQR